VKAPLPSNAKKAFQFGATWKRKKNQKPVSKQLENLGTHNVQSEQLQYTSGPKSPSPRHKALSTSLFFGQPKRNAWSVEKNNGIRHSAEHRCVYVYPCTKSLQIKLWEINQVMRNDSPMIWFKNLYKIWCFHGDVKEDKTILRGLCIYLKPIK